MLVFNFQQEEEPKAAPVFDLIDIPNSELTEEQQKEKRKQIFLKSTTEGRLRAKQAREEEQARLLAMEQEEERKRLQDPEAWLEGLRKERQEIVARRAERQRLKDEVR